MTSDRTPPPAAAPRVRAPHPSQRVRRRETGCDGGDLAARQAALLDALVAGGADPPGFDAVRLAATRAALLRKRAGLAAKEWPRLAAALGAQWPTAFADRFAGIPPTDGLREGWDLARMLRERGELPDGAVAELDAREAAWRYDGHAAPSRRGRLSAALRRRTQRR